MQSRDPQYAPRLKVCFESSHFLIRTISSYQDLHEVLKLRSRCFPLKSTKPDRFDLAADHLVVEDRVSRKICGAYRVTCSDHADEFESAFDFNLEKFLGLSDRKIELAWACVDPDYRNHMVISMLWRGLAEIFRQLQPRYVFGLTSVGAQELTGIQDFCKFIETQRPLDHQLQIRPQTTKCAALPIERKESAEGFSLRKIPSLLRIYILAGALICAQPAFDPDINVYDFFTVLDMDQCSDKILNHFDL